MDRAEMSVKSKEAPQQLPGVDLISGGDVAELAYLVLPSDGLTRLGRNQAQRWPPRRHQPQGYQEVREKKKKKGVRPSTEGPPPSSTEGQRQSEPASKSCVKPSPGLPADPISSLAWSSSAHSQHGQSSVM